MVHTCEFEQMEDIMSLFRTVYDMAPQTIPAWDELP